MLKNPFSQLSKKDYIVWGVSLAVVGVSILLSPDVSITTLFASLIGVTALIFLAKGDVWGQFLSMVFASLYAITSLSFRYYGEAITYMFMTFPSALACAVSWLRHPYKDNANEVEISRLTKTQKALLPPLAVLTTIVFFYVLRALNTPNLTFSTLSILTSFIASYLTFFRSPYYAVAYSFNDVVLIVLWTLASIEKPSYIPMIMCFVMFLVNDIYGFISWKIREKKQLE